MIDPDFDAIIFDCDGTLVDSESLTVDVLVGYMREMSHELCPKEALSLFVGRDMPTVVTVLEERLGHELPKDFVDEFRVRQSAALRAGLQPIEGVFELLDAITKPYCVASNAPHYKIAINLETTGLDRYFPQERTFSAYDIEIWKPEPDLFLHAAKKMSVTPERCVVIEDSLAGVQAGQAAGMQVIGFSQEPNIKPSEEVPCVWSLRDLISVLGDG